VTPEAGKRSHSSYAPRMAKSHASKAPRHSSSKGDRVLVARNKRAYFDYEILETLECGIQLQGSEVKSLRAGNANLRDSFARVEDGEIWAEGIHIAQWDFSHGMGAHQSDRRRKLLLHRREIDRLAGKTKESGTTLIPLSIYFKDGKAKLELGLAKGKRQWDKRRAIAERDSAREAAREIAERNKMQG
jgi:SsrA-binding protein